MECLCGKFRFAGPGEFRNCEAYINGAGESCAICPKCGRHYRDSECILEPNVPDETLSEDNSEDKSYERKT